MKSFKTLFFIAILALSAVNAQDETAVAATTTATTEPAGPPRPSPDFLQNVLNQNLATFSHSDLRRKLYNLQDGKVGSANWQADSTSDFTFKSADGRTSLRVNQVAINFGVKPDTYKPDQNDLANDDWAAAPDVKFNGVLQTATHSYGLNNLNSFFRPNSTVRLVPSKGDVGLFTSSVNGIEYQPTDANAASTEADWTDLFPWMRVGRLECEIGAHGNAEIALNFNAHHDLTGDKRLALNLVSGCLDQEYTKNAIRTDTKSHHMCLVQFGDLFIGCAKANLPEQYRDQELRMADPAAANEHAQIFDENQLPFYRWHPFFGFRAANETFTVKSWINMLLFNPRVRPAANAHPDVVTPQTGKTNVANFKKWLYCACPSGENYYIDDAGNDACNFDRNREVCAGGSVRCLNYGATTEQRFFSDSDNHQWPGNAYESVVCGNHEYNYNRLQVNSLKLHYGFGVIEKFFCTSGSKDELCGENNFTGANNVLTYLLTDSVEALDINNRMRIVHGLTDTKNGTFTNTDLANHTNELNKRYRNYTDEKVADLEAKAAAKRAEYESERDLFNQNIEKYKSAINDMRNAENIDQYNNAYARWTEVENHFKQKGCAPPVPPKPPTVLIKPKIEDKCHRAYKLGWKIGKDLALLITEAGDSYSELLKQMHCVKEYVSQVEAGKDNDIKSRCLDKGRKEASRLIWGLARHPARLKKYLEQAKTFDHWKLTYKMGYDKYLKDLLNLEGAETDHVNLNTDVATVGL